MMIFLHFLQNDYYNHHYNPFNLSLLQICRSCRVSIFQKVYVFFEKNKNAIFQILSLERSWAQPLAGEMACCP